LASRIEVKPVIPDTRAYVRKRHLEELFSGIEDVSLVDVYTVDKDLDESQLEKVASMLTNPVIEKSSINSPLAPENFSWAVEIGFLPGVTDNIAATAREGVEDSLKTSFEAGEGIYSSQVTFVSGKLTREDALAVGEALANPLIQRIQVKNYDEFIADKGMGVIVPRVRLEAEPKVDVVDLEVPDEELVRIGKEGIRNKDGTRRGPLALDLTYMYAIRDYFRKQGRNPTDVELESIAQTWSEHCKHTIFANPIDEITDGLFRHFIKAATNRVRNEKGDKDFCVSVFTDNAGAIIFDEAYLVADKVETHNTPSALDPFGGSITGIVGVNRDPIGFGLGAKPIINRYGYCFADPRRITVLYKSPNKTQKMPSARRIMEGVILGVNAGGNQSGIPTNQGFVFFDERYRGKPLVFVGTVGLIPRKSAGRPAHEKKAQPDDYIVMLGGRVGQDGIHGATFSSEALNTGSPATAVQIGDPITQKKLSDAIIKEARDLGLYNSITDNGAGGLSCSVAEMAKECNGCYVKLEKVPLKYPNLESWKIWVSESQERMTLSVPKEKWSQFKDLMERRGVEATVIGEFTDSGRCVVDYADKRVMDVDLGFLHDGLPARPMHTTYTRPIHEEPEIPLLEDLTESLYKMLRRPNIASFEFISHQYDHEVQGGSVIKPLQGRGRVNGRATVTRPVLSSKKGIVTSQGINPSYGDIDMYHMAACAIDTAIRNSISVGAKLDYLALLDNFCWCSSDEPERLGQLKEAARACYDYAVAFGTPFISGKDSMFNDFKGFDKNNNPVKISVPPTLLISSLGVMEDSRKAVSLDAKIDGDLVYLLGERRDELGASEYFAMLGEEQKKERFVGNNVPKVDAEKNKKLYRALSDAIDEELIASAESIALGGLGVALAKTAIGGQLGLEVSLENIPGDASRDDFALYSESQGGLVVTVAPQYKERFEEVMQGNAFTLIGKVTSNQRLVIKGLSGKKIVDAGIEELTRSYKQTFKEY
jgi:phosphoribosylformylglycinamidine synthase